MAGISNPFHFFMRPSACNLDWTAESSSCFCESLFLRHHRDCLSKILQLNHFWHFLAWVFHIWVNRLLTRTFKETYFFQRLLNLTAISTACVGQFCQFEPCSESHLLWRYWRKRIILVNFASVLELFRRLLEWIEQIARLLQWAASPTGCLRLWGMPPLRWEACKKCKTNSNAA